MDDTRLTYLRYLDDYSNPADFLMDIVEGLLTPICDDDAVDDKFCDGDYDFMETPCVLCVFDCVVSWFAMLVLDHLSSNNTPRKQPNRKKENSQTSKNTNKRIRKPLH